MAMAGGANAGAPAGARHTLNCLGGFSWAKYNNFGLLNIALRHTSCSGKGNVQKKKIYCLEIGKAMHEIKMDIALSGYPC